MKRERYRGYCPAGAAVEVELDRRISHYIDVQIADHSLLSLTAPFASYVHDATLAHIVA